MTLKEMVAHYNKMTAADGYIVGFTFKHLLYYVSIDGHLPEEILKFDRASSKRGGTAKVRVRVPAGFRKAMVETGKAIMLGAESLLQTEDRYNKGERFERIITERLTGETWIKDSIPFTDAGDIELDGRQIQIKLTDAELTNEKTLERILTTA